MGRLDSFEVPRSVLTKLDFESSKTVLFEVDRTRGTQVQRTDTTVEKEISGELMMISRVICHAPAVFVYATRFVGFTGRGESVSLVGKVGDSELPLLRCCFIMFYWNKFQPRYRRLSAPLQSMLVELIYSIMKAGL